MLDANAERHLKSPAEMARLFARWPHAIAATRRVRRAHQLQPRRAALRISRRAGAAGLDAAGTISSIWPGRARATRYPDGCPTRSSALLDEELALIEQLDYARYFLTVHDIVAFAARAAAILCQGRGSAANSRGLLSASASPRSIPTEHRPAVRALHLRGAQRAARHRRRFRARAARGGDPVYLRALRPRARRDRRDRDPLPPAHGDPRGRQGAGPDGGRHARALAGTHLGRMAHEHRRTSTSARPGSTPTNPRSAAAIDAAPSSCSASRATCRSMSAASC